MKPKYKEIVEAAASFEADRDKFVSAMHDAINAFRQIAAPHSYSCPSSGQRFLQTMMDLQHQLRKANYASKELIHDLERIQPEQTAGQQKMVL